MLSVAAAFNRSLYPYLVLQCAVLCSATGGRAGGRFCIVELDSFCLNSLKFDF
jgi:hypothetical protein